MITKIEEGVLKFLVEFCKCTNYHKECILFVKSIHTGQLVTKLKHSQLYVFIRTYHARHVDTCENLSIAKSLISTFL